MRKVISSLFLTLFVLPVFAQSGGQEKTTALENAQKMLAQSNAQAQKQFAKAYPMPVAPSVPGAQSSSGALPPPKYVKPAPQNPVADNSRDNYGSVSAPAVKAPSDIIAEKKNTNSPSQNIFLPPGSDNNANNTNAYR